MSRGPGRVEQIIEAAFRASPDDAFVVDELAALAFHGINLPDKKHRVSVGRAARKVAARLGWTWRYRDHQKGASVYYNPLSVRSHGLAFALAHDYGGKTEALMALADPEHQHWRSMQPGGVFHLHVAMYRAKLAGDQDEHDRLNDQLIEAVRGKPPAISTAERRARGVLKP
jgi:hypothetical protein